MSLAARIGHELVNARKITLLRVRALVENLLLIHPGEQPTQDIPGGTSKTD